jgi:integration host factor subunit alpha
MRTPGKKSRRLFWHVCFSLLLRSASVQTIGLVRSISLNRVITDCLERGETVKLSSFGLFVVRKKGQRMGRNPKTGEEAPISPRRVVVFKPYEVLKQRINAPRSPSQ